MVFFTAFSSTSTLLDDVSVESSLALSPVDPSDSDSLSEELVSDSDSDSDSDFDSDPDSEPELDTLAFGID